MRIAVIECDSPIHPVRECLGTYGDMFERLLIAGLKGLKWENIVDLKVIKMNVADNPVFPSPETYDAILLTGGKWDAFSDSEWIVKLTEYVAKIFKETTKPILGVCFGHQIIARALGAPVGRGGEGWEIAVEPIVLNDIGRSLFGKETLALHQMHRDIAYEVPMGCANVGSTPKCKIQGLYMPQRILTVQGHPEHNEFVIRTMIEMRRSQGIFGADLAENGLSRVENEHDGVVVAQAFCKFVHETLSS
ncbi:predicted protein [Uncinocarpus reesii 1704]|uniref:Glutamine amidotransferase domain-containing protein n=1 Tax=Uncinocarpus reesii (strain UAMH 1704) TaxID=336963 RepID=C4JSY9_UNCRE|nr:uncharacterized protein UREG_05578 [Uncinocarpus reesii 1704]EEP80736.1 predicted protein [Uncinocarpus reesii 1704]